MSKISLDGQTESVAGFALSQDQINAAVERGRPIWDELMARTDGPLPFVEFDADDPSIIVSPWCVTDSGDQEDDIIRGYCYAELLIGRAKNWRDRRTTIDPFRIIQEVFIEIARKGRLGPVERGFYARISIATLAASLN